MSTELAARTQGLTIRNVDELARIADMMAKSGYFRDAADAAQAGVKILAGQGWGIQPFDAMTGIHVIQGKPAVGAGLMAAKVKGSGRYDYRVRQMTPEVCEIEFFEGSESLGVSSFTIAEAKAAGTQNLNKFPRNMLFARAMSNGVKWYCPDVFNAPVYVPEELGATVDGDGNVIDVDSRPAPARAAIPEPAPAEAPPAMSTQKQWQAMGIAMRELQFEDTDEGKQRAREFFSWLANLTPPVTSVKDFTAAEAATILDRIGSGENGSYRTDEQKLAEALNAWHEHLDITTNPVPEFDPNVKPGKKAQKVKDMAPITDADTTQEVLL